MRASINGWSDGTRRSRSSNFNCDVIGERFRVLNKRKTTISLGLLIPGIVCLFIFGASLASIGIMSLRPSRLADAGFSINQYLRFFSDTYHLIYLWRSFKVSIYGTLLTLLFGYPVAYLMARSDARLRLMLTLLLVVQFFSSYIIRAYALMIVLGNNGIINRVLIKTGLIHSPLPLMHNETGVAIGLVMVSLPFMVFPIYSVVKGIDLRLEEAAESLGAGEWLVFWNVTLPLSLPGVAAGVIIVLLFQLTSFIVPGLLGGGYFDMVANFIYDQALGVLNIPFAAAVAMVTLVIALGLVVVLNKLFQRNLKDVSP
jgi:ABC-type spermidine/putrescine transport system permease subunit I